MSDGPRLTELLARDELVDVGHRGEAAQSTISRWSRPNDAQSALWGSDRDFAFHTDAEDAPWWSLMFEPAQKLQYLVLENRRNARFRHLADNLLVTAQTDAANIVLYDSVERFGIQEEDSALVIPLGDVPPVVQVKITARTQGGYLHLSRVRALADMADAPASMNQPREKPLCFIANRTDGFGERLRAVLNAMVAAEVCGGEMGLDWPQLAEEFFSFNDVLPITQTFEKGFLKRRHVSTKDIKALASITTANDRLRGGGAAAVPHYIDAVVMDQRPIERQLGGLEGIDIAARYKAAFEAIEFAPPLARARSLAMELDLGGEFIALHLRAGDIVYGKFRAIGGFTGKAIAYPVIAKLIQMHKKAGKAVLLFGQDKPMCRHLADTYGAHLGADFAQEYRLDKYQSALFEICLMSRCREIYSGGSGFATLASWIGAAKNREVNKKLNGREIVDIILAGTDESTQSVSDLQKAYANFYILQRHPGIMTKQERRDTLHRCVVLDPDNPLYQLMSAAYYYEHDAPDAAEAQLALFSRRAVEWDLMWNLSYVTHNNMIRHHLPAFKAPAEAGHPMAALCLGLRAQALGNTVEAAHYAALYRANKGDLQTPLAARLADAQ